jgi:Ca2+-binding EF-hand superfamily protein
MRTKNLPAIATFATFILFFGPAPGFSQIPPAEGKGSKIPGTKGSPDEFRAVLKEVEEAYKAPFEVDKDILDELRKQYRQPTPEREAKIFREIRRLYEATPEQDQTILREIRRAYERPSAEQEERVFVEIRRGRQLPLGTVPPTIQVEQAAKLFRRLDQDGDGLISPVEMTDSLREQRGRWDRNHDGFIDFEEYGGYYQATLQSVAERVATGEIPIKLPRGLTVQDLIAPAAERRHPEGEERRSVARAGKLPQGLPDWFAQLDTDGDGQIGLYEWRKAGRPVDEFTRMDLDGDFLLTPQELLSFLAEQSGNRSGGSLAADSRRFGPSAEPGNFAKESGSTRRQPIKGAAEGKPKSGEKQR